MVALLRGINVGGHKKFPKAEQIEMLSNLSLENPHIYLHTGNWIFTTSESKQAISKKIEAAIAKSYGWDVPVLVLKSAELKKVFIGCPFSDEKKEQSYFVLFKSKPLADDVSKIQKVSFPGEEFHVGEMCVYFFPAMGAGRAKLSTNFFENKLKVTATARNYRTMAKLMELISSL